MGKQQTRKQQRKQQQKKQQRQQGGVEEVEEVVVENVSEVQEGGRRHRRKGTRKLSPWNKFVKKIYHQMKGQNKKTTFGQALKEASKRKKEM